MSDKERRQLRQQGLRYWIVKADLIARDLPFDIEKIRDLKESLEVAVDILDQEFKP